MSRLAALWRSEPAAITALVVALVGALAIPDAWAKVVMALIAVAGGLVTRTQVYSAPTVTNLVTDAAAKAITDISSETAGSAGTLGDAGAVVAAQTAAAVLETVPGPASR